MSPRDKEVEPPPAALPLRTVDLFCGCGGLTLGFELHKGRILYETTLAVDIDSAALKVFNNNVPSGREIATGRLADLSWFSHRSEVLLYYLAHYTLWAGDGELRSRLDALGFRNFLSTLRALDASYSKRATEVTSQPEYRQAWNKVDSRVGSLALFKSAMSKLGLRSFKSGELDTAALPWHDEFNLFIVAFGKATAAPHPALIDSARTLWGEQIARLKETAKKTGRGQHSVVAERVEMVVDFLSSKHALQLQQAWVDWRAKRDSIRASFCLKAEAALQDLYQSGRQVHLLLGGPPCKGWSRIGRAVIESLREQGVHAWECKKFGDERNALLHKYVLFLDALRPSAFLFENVAHFESSLRTPTGHVNAANVLAQSISDLASSDLNFDVEARIVRAREHGVPQDRERYIMVGMRGNDRASEWLREFFVSLPRYSEVVPLKVSLLGLDDPGVFDRGDSAGPNGTNYRSKCFTLFDAAMPAATKDYIAWVRQPPPGNARAPSTVDGHIVRTPRADDRELFRYLAPGTRWMDYKFRQTPTLRELQAVVAQVKAAQINKERKGLPSIEVLDALLAKLNESLYLRLMLEAIDPPSEGSEGHHLLQEGYLTKGSDHHGDWLERLSPDRPCKTIVAHIGKDTYGYIHPYQPRALSLREAGRIQSFPDYFSLGGVGIVDAYSMIGNAVPPLLASHFARSFETLHEHHHLFSAPNSRVRAPNAASRNLAFTDRIEHATATTP